ncbi:hypothetical protein LUZ60_016362 [Juncus effusus]|nr:hypothetical protein LUZ60_016362 [Juncus effusus]
MQGLRLFDAHCHLQDARFAGAAPGLIRTAVDSGVLRFAVNGVSEKDWSVVKEMSDQYACVIPSFGLHPWYVAERSPNWFDSLNGFFLDTPCAAVGEIGLDKGSHGKTIEFGEQVEVFQKQLELAKELKRPVSVHCVRAFGDLLEILKKTGPFPEGIILHSYMGSKEMISELSNLGSYFSFSGFLTSMKEQKAKNMLKSVPKDKILLETDAPDGLSQYKTESLLRISETESLNHPANIHNVLEYVSMLLEMPKEQLAEISYQNALRLFSFPGSKIHNGS